MRRYEHLDSYLESFEAAARKIKNPESTQQINGNLTVCNPEDDEAFDEEYSETVSNESEGINEPEEELQLRLF